MPMQTIVIIGGGPAGLYAAALLKQQHPDAGVTVYERDPFERTLGFGIGLSSRTRDALAATDPEIYEQIERAGTFLDEQDFRLPNGRVVIRNPVPSLNVERAKLREIVADVAVRRGVEMKIGSSVTIDDIDGDLVVLADGVNSTGRRQLAPEFGATVELGRELYLWCGADFALPSSTFAPVATEHGTFTAHAYRYRDDRSTVLIETDEATWKRAGFDRSTEALAAADAGASDDEAIAFLQTAFDEILEGHRLLGNRSRWTRFPTVRCERWSHGRFVLLGDAAHTAHYSLGSGTKAAMEDAIGLAAALGSHDDVGEALVAYERDRHPTVDRLQTMAQRSQWWWESLVRRLDLDASRVAISYLTRGGSITLDKLRATSPDLVAAAIGDYLGTHGGDLPEDLNRFVIDAAGGRADALAGDSSDEVDWGFRDSQGADADDLVDGLASGATDARVRVHGSDDRDRLIDQLAFCERIRLEAKRPVDVVLSPTVADLGAAALVAGRIDRVLVPPTAD